ncbi:MULTISPECIES: Crp/Fnr family transcriptional regulator [Sphingobacterium]|uniref:Crp/Fnr family transcriptional regulator n=1 Tax=Sphingobacterium TaxID=28453 RepID=UPI0010480D42|nr:MULTISPECIES: Crp/Fnr family transcriptional regulator [Sphingobacterium]MCW2260192.1 CRP-like cAMP-binding protein [Sphingobacterium kitahiroshimense]NJI71902.1 Crp/Fnr family transcriptional regulator [Sphingobacterium sp. B16(2022)]TCR11019.1 CRP-like cAMP-binding protein [Sphingobacterium sp. JUb78]
MGIDNLIALISTYARFSETDIAIIKSKFTQHKFKQKEYILEEGQVSTHLHFIAIGLVRIFYVKDGKEITSYLSSDNGFVSSYSSFINQSKSYEYIQCLEKSQTLAITYKDMQELYEAVPQWERIGRFFSEQNVLCLADRLLKLQSIPAKEKYLEFLKTSSEKIVQRTPLIHIASYLGITPESLSRIRSEIS